MVDVEQAQKLDMALRAYIKNLCAPLWWESERQTIVNYADPQWLRHTRRHS